MENVGEVLDQVLKEQDKMESLIGKLSEFKDDETKRCLAGIHILLIPLNF